jgi:hypothetical protein
MRKGLQVGLPEQGYWAELRYFPDSTLGVRAVPALADLSDRPNDHRYPGFNAA